MKKIAVVLLLTLILPSGIGFAGAATAADSKTQVVDVGNTKCPVMGGPVSGNTFLEYQGKRYGTCCGGCAGEFSKNPEKHLADLAAVTPQKS